MLSKKNIAACLAIALLSSANLPAKTTKKAPNERALPLKVEADSAVYTDVTQTSLFKGRVILIQGSMKIEADNVETIVDPEGYQYATATMNGNGLVKFEQKRQGTNEIIKGQGKVLIYDGKQNLVQFSQTAQMRRLGANGNLLDKLDGDELVYNQLTELFESHALPGGTGRTRMIITPNTQSK
jgi:lipopolysaccharide export system protein LptA